MLRFASLALAALLTSPALAQDGPLDPATVAVPDVSGGRDSDVVRNGWKFFYFWRPDTTYEQAYADFADCYQFLPVAGGDALLPMFIAWQGREALDEMPSGAGNQYGIVGAALGALVAGPIARRASQSRMRRCMEPRGYQRFPAREEAWEAIVDGYSQESIAVSAVLASGPRPDADPLPEDR